ncbi:MAG: GAF domain-containing protein [Pirellulaceae bacterium]
MVVDLVLATSVAFQAAAAVLAVRLMWSTSGKWSWGLISVGIALMVSRRCVPLYRALTGDPGFTADMTYELVGLVISFCLFAGVAGISPRIAKAARDVAFALHRLQLEEARNRVEQVLRLDESRLETLLKLNQMTDASLKEITDFALEEAVRLTQSEIGYLAFLNDDESMLTMHSWSKSAMAECEIIDKPIVYAVEATGLWGEAVRQRQPVITNDYPAPSPWKKGYPAGHVHVTRHMNAPVFEGDRIVVLAGVGNKAEPYNESDVRQLSLLMQGMWRLLHRKQAAEALQAAHDQLEIRVAERTAELIRARDAAEAASRAKSTFLATMSHEIRTPLNAVIGMTELVLKSELAAQQREFLTTVRDSGEALLAVINDILDFSKIEAGELQLDRRTFDLHESLGDTLKSFAIRARQQGLKLTTVIHPEVPHTVIGDYSRLRQVIVNLVGNSLKFTEQGEVILEVSRESQSPHEALVHFTVSDTGIGIPPEKQLAIFEMFEQVDGSTTRRFGGTGLGLAIASRLLALMDGRIWVESEVGQGSRFHFTVKLGLPAAEPAEPVSPGPAGTPVEVPDLRILTGEDPATGHRHSARNLRVLLAEDSLVNQKLAVALLQDQGHHVTVVPNGREAVAASAAEPFDVILMDVQMPEMDGLAATAAIRAREQTTGGRVPIVAMTAYALPGDRERCLEAGMDGYVAKPIRAQELLHAIASLSPADSRPAEPDPAPVVTPVVAPVVTPVVSPVIAWAAALEAVQGDQELLRTVVAAAIEEIPQMMVVLREATASRDAPRLHRAAHTLKSSLRYFGAKDAAELAWQLEVVGKEVRLDDVSPLLADLEPLAEQVRAELSTYLQSSTNAPAPG